MNIWQELYRFAKARAPTAIKTTLLGSVPYSVVGGRYESQIPWQLQHEANMNGLRIIAADYRSDTYVVEILPNNDQRGRRDASSQDRPGSSPVPLD